MSSYMSPAKNGNGVSLPCPNNHPDTGEKRKLEYQYPVYRGVSDEFRQLMAPGPKPEDKNKNEFRVSDGMTIPELFEFIGRVIQK